VANWDRNAALAETRGGEMPNVAIRRMWIYHHDLEIQVGIYADAKTEYGRRLSRVVVQCRQEGEKSYDVCKHIAEMDPEVHDAHLAYRLAEQMIAADKEALRILHAELEAYRTQAADQRAADTFQARTQP
jgi:hypothetical protein